MYSRASMQRGMGFLVCGGCGWTGADVISHRSTATGSKCGRRSPLTPPLLENGHRIGGLRRSSLSSVSMAVDRMPDEGLIRPEINWYPGHIAKAERKLKEMISVVDVVLEMRDCRIPTSTAHPLVKEWVKTRPRLLVMNRQDMAPEISKNAWRRCLQSEGVAGVYFTNSKLGDGVAQLRRAALQAGSYINEKRKRRGLLPRPIRCMVIGFPNVGKSALINRLVNRKAAKSANKPGVTRGLQWVRISESIELLDTPGIIPMKLISQEAASRLAVCDDIGGGAYDNQIVAAFLIEELRRVAKTLPGFVDQERIEARYGVAFDNLAGDEYLEQVSAKSFSSDLERCAQRFLTDFRNGLLGELSLEAPEGYNGYRKLAESQVPEEMEQDDGVDIIS